MFCVSNVLLLLLNERRSPNAKSLGPCDSKATFITVSHTQMFAVKWSATLQDDRRRATQCATEIDFPDRTIFMRVSNSQVTKRGGTGPKDREDLYSELGGAYHIEMLNDVNVATTIEKAQVIEGIQIQSAATRIQQFGIGDESQDYFTELSCWA